MTDVDDYTAAIRRGRVRAAVEVLQACGAEVVEEWGVRLVWDDDTTDDSWRDDRETATRDVAAHHAGGWERSYVVRRLRLVLPAETVEEAP